MAEILTLTSEPDEPSERIDRWLAQAAEDKNLSRTRIKNLILDGHLNCHGQIITDPSISVKPDTVYELIFSSHLYQ